MLKIEPRLLLLLIFLLPNHSWAAREWFTEQTSIIRAHKALLEGDLKQSFDSMVEAWQSNPEPYEKEHLDGLLLKGLDVDCGRGFDPSGYPHWLDKLTIQRQEVQNTGRLSYSLNIDVLTTLDINKLSFIRWPSRSLLTHAKLTNEKVNDKYHNNSQIDLNTEIESGLYKIQLETTSGKNWEHWVILASPNNEQSVRWKSKDSWIIDKTALLNRYCPLPVLDVMLYGILDGDYKKVWSEEYESNYPKTVPASNLPANRYLLGVSMTHKHWQGLISIEYKQVINKTYDLSN